MKIIRLIFKKLLSFKHWFVKRSLFAKAGIIILAVVIGWFGYSRLTAKTEQPQYQVTKAEKGNLIVTVTGSGQVSTANNVSVTTQASGVVKKVYVQNGQEVKSGTRIAEIELDRLSQQKYSQALASWQSAKNNLDSNQVNLWTLQSKLFAANQKFMNDAVARDLETDDPTYIQENADWLAAEATYKNQTNIINQAKTTLNSAALSLEQSSPLVYAPISGEINGLSLQVGTVIASDGTSSDSTSTSQKIANILTKTNPTITINLTEIDAPKVKVGNKTTITLDAYSGKTWTGKVASIDLVGSISSGVTSYPTVIILDSQNSEILPKMSASANIIIQTKNDVLLVPSGAVQTTNDQTFVRVLRNGKEEQIAVGTGLSSDTQVEIISGIEEGETIITSVTTTQSGRSNQSQSPFGFGGGTRFMAR